MKMSAENPEKDKQITASDIARMTDAEVLEALRSLLDKNMAEFDATLEGLTKEEIAEMPEVAATRDIYCFLQYDYELERRNAELLLRMDNPLQFSVDNWPCYNLTELAMNALGEGPVKEAEKKATSSKFRTDTQKIFCSKRDLPNRRLPAGSTKRRKNAPPMRFIKRKIENP